MNDHRGSLGFGPRALIVLALAGALLTAGCIGMGGGDGEDGEDAGTTSAPSNQTATPTPDGAGQGPANTTQENTTGANEASLERRNVSFEGQLGAEVVACGPAGCAGTFTCVAAVCQQPVSDPRTERSFPVDHEAPVQEVNATLTWDPVSPVTEELRFGLAWSCEDGCTFEYVEGASPLTIEMADLGITSDLSIFVWTPDQGPDNDPTTLHATHDQPFTIEGQVATGGGG